jgi:hypothetical protein
VRFLVPLHRAQRPPYRRLPTDEQVEIPSGMGDFTVIVSPTCPVAGYANCILSGPQELQSSISYRNLLPSPSFKPDALLGPYRMTATYVDRPG